MYMISTVIIESVLLVYKNDCPVAERRITHDLNPVLLRCKTTARRTVSIPSAAMAMPSAALVIHCEAIGTLIRRCLT